MFGRGYLAVDFFLMLDGLLMARVQEARMVGGFAAWRFMARRYRRLWPMMALSGAIGLPLQYLRSHGLGDFLSVSGRNLLLLPATSRGFAFPLNIPAWTIFAQLVCEAAHVALLRRITGRWLWLMVGLMLPAWLAIAHGAGGLNVGPRPMNLAPGLVRCLFAYALGMGLGRAWRGASVPPVPPILALIAMPAALVGLWAAGAHGWWIDPLLVVTLCPMMLAGGMRLTRGSGIARRAGRLGFPLFALQMPVLQGLSYLGARAWVGVAAALVAAVVGARLEPWLARRRRVM